MKTELKTAVIDGKKVKLYPAFNSERHAHDIEYRRNYLLNRLEEMPIKDFNEAQALINDLTEILAWIGFPMTYLPYNLYKVARETIFWAGNNRGYGRRSF